MRGARNGFRLRARLARIGGPWLFLLISLNVPGAASAAMTSEPLMTLRGDLAQPTAVAVDPSGRAYVLDGMRGRVAVFDEEGAFLFAFGREGAGENELTLAMDLAVTADSVVVADTGNHRLAIFGKEGRFRRTVPLTVAEGESPEPVGLLVVGGTAIWSDRRNHRVCRTLLKDGSLLGCWGRRGQGEGEFRNPFMAAADSQGYVHVVDVLNGRVQLFSAGGRPFGLVSRFGTGPGELYRPNGIAHDGQRLFVSDAYLGTISIFRERAFAGVVSDAEGRAREFAAPVGIARWRDRLYVVDGGANEVQVLRLDRETPAEPPPKSSSTSSRMNCVTCHISWAPDRRDSERAGDPLLLPVSTVRMCYSCHHGAVVDSRADLQSGHQHPDLDHPLAEGEIFQKRGARKDPIADAFPLLDDSTPYCGTCHTPHRTKGGDDLDGTHEVTWMRMAGATDSMCVECHGSRVDDVRLKRRPYRGINHPVGTYLKQPPRPGAHGHASEPALRRDGLPSNLKRLGARLGSEQDLVCESCHRVHGAGETRLLVSPTEQSGLCIACHERQHGGDREEARRKGVHPVNIDLEEPVRFGEREITGVTCLTCHSVHDGEEGTALLTKEVAADGLCRACHARQHADGEEDAAAKGVHPVNLTFDEPRKMGDLEIGELRCQTCHSVHRGEPETPALVADHRDGTLCGYCHEAETAVAGTDHELVVTAENAMNRFEQSPAQAGLCGSCHSMHRNEEAVPFLSAVTPGWDGDQAVTARDRLCLDCHREGGAAEAKPITDFTHPSEELVLRSDPAVMPLLDKEGKLGAEGVIGCITCHEPHHWAPGEDSKGQRTATENREGNVLDSFLRNKGVRNTFCIHCHGFETPVKYKYYHDKRARDGRGGQIR